MVSVTAKQNKNRKSIASKVKLNNATALHFENTVVESFSVEKQQDNRVSKRAIKGQVSGRYNPTLYMVTILYKKALVLSVAGALPVLPIANC